MRLSRTVALHARLLFVTRTALQAPAILYSLCYDILYSLYCTHYTILQAPAAQRVMSVSRHSYTIHHTLHTIHHSLVHHSPYHAHNTPYTHTLIHHTPYTIHHTSALQVSVEPHTYCVYASPPYFTRVPSLQAPAAQRVVHRGVHFSAAQPQASDYAGRSGAHRWVCSVCSVQQCAVVCSSVQ
jgi:hypothetical protein